MGREVKRVPLDFDWPLDKVWKGYVLPESLRGSQCPDCEGGQTHLGWWVQNVTYLVGMLAADVHDQQHGQGLHPWLANFSRAHGHWEYLRDVAWVHINDIPDRPVTGTSRWVVDRPGPKEQSLDFFHGLLRAYFKIRAESGDEYAYLYQDRDLPSRDEVGSTLGSSSSTGNMDLSHAILGILTHAAGVDFVCRTCDGDGVLEDFPGQKAERHAWFEADHYEEDGPPVGEGWQLWETVSEGSPISPVFDSAEKLAEWLCSPSYTWGASGPMSSYERALVFVRAGWAPSFVSSPETGLLSGEEFIGTKEN
jgi:hypothetical protein